jgi:hypothetical protein
LVGRLPVISPLTPLDEDSLVRVLTEPKNALVKQYQALFAMEEAELGSPTEACGPSPNGPMEKDTGARGLALDHRGGDARHHVRAARPARLRAALGGPSRDGTAGCRGRNPPV